MKPKKKLFLLALVLSFSTRMANSQIPTAIKEKFQKKNISELNPKIVVTAVGKSVAFSLVIKDTTARVASECFEWVLDSIPSISRVAELDNQMSICETPPLPLNGLSASIDWVEKVSKLKEGPATDFYVKAITSEQNPVFLMDGIRLGSAPLSYASAPKGRLKIKVRFEAKGDCLSYELNEKTDECIGKYLPIQWDGVVQKELELMIGETNIGLK
jgi:hypothetical protein